MYNYFQVFLKTDIANYSLYTWDKLPYYLVLKLSENSTGFVYDLSDILVNVKENNPTSLGKFIAQDYLTPNSRNTVINNETNKYDLYFYGNYLNTLVYLTTINNNTNNTNDTDEGNETTSYDIDDEDTTSDEIDGFEDNKSNKELGKNNKDSKSAIKRIGNPVSFILLELLFILTAFIARREK